MVSWKEEHSLVGPSGCVRSRLSRGGFCGWEAADVAFSFKGLPEQGLHFGSKAPEASKPFIFAWEVTLNQGIAQVAIKEQFLSGLLPL